MACEQCKFWETRSGSDRPLNGLCGRHNVTMRFDGGCGDFVPSQIAVDFAEIAQAIDQVLGSPYFSPPRPGPPNILRIPRSLYDMDPMPDLPGAWPDCNCPDCQERRRLP
jgi:hypothetical protein